MTKYRGVGRVSFNVSEVVMDALEKASVTVSIDGARGFRTGMSFEVEFNADTPADALVHAHTLQQVMQERVGPLFQIDGIDVREWFPPLDYIAGDEATYE
jgi:hypothetical protein